MKIILIAIILLFLVAFFIISENSLSLRNEEDINEFKTTYNSWINQTFEDMKGFTSYVIKMEWLPGE